MLSRLAVRSTAASARKYAQTGLAVRLLHRLPRYHFDVDQGMGDFLTPAGLKALAVEYQTGLLDRINEIVQGAS
jgi:superoxide dismutase, Fe-Mn family